MSNQNNQDQKREPLYIEMTQHEKFEKLASTAMTTTQHIAKRINKLFSSAFVDYYGAAIYVGAGMGNVTPNTMFAVELHFKPIAPGAVSADEKRIRAFRPIDENVDGKKDIVAGLKMMYSSIRSSASFQLTEEAAQILSEFMLPGLNIDPFKPSSYDMHRAEYLDNQQFGQSPIMAKISGLDLTRLIKKIYGTRNEDGKRVDYGIIPYGPVNPMVQNTAMANNANWRVAILQLEAEKMYDVATECGIIPAGNGSVGPIITGTI